MIVEEIEKILAKTPTANIAVFLRHSERYEIPRGTGGGEILLTPHGVEMAETLGIKLRQFGLDVKIYSSPVLRCVQTANCINSTLSKHRNEIRLVNELGMPGLHINNWTKASDMYQNIDVREVYKMFLRDVKDIGITEKDILEKLVKDFIQQTIADEGLTLYITNDALVAHIKTALNLAVVDVEHGEWIDFLGGFAIPGKLMGYASCGIYSAKIKK